MLDSLKSLWSKWKVQVSVVGGVLIVATAYGTCSYEAPTVDEEAPSAEEAAETTTETTTTESTAETNAGTPVNADVTSDTTTGEAVTAEEK
tara:strand:+ start:1572 stop:1844 length:273 start_codon:yes stop_codon:yes gene_type:complete